MVWAVDTVDEDDAVLVLRLEVLEEYDDATSPTSSSRSVDCDFDVEDGDEPGLAAVAVVLGAWAANHAPRPRNEAALTAPVMRRARRAGCGFFVVGMRGACARRGNER